MVLFQMLVRLRTELRLLLLSQTQSTLLASLPSMNCSVNFD